MATIHFVREPGFTYDLFFCFILYFNREYCMTEYINQNKAKQDTDFLNRLLAAVGHIPDELGLFFRVRKDGRSFMTNTFFGPYKDCFATTYDLTIVREALTDVPRLVGQLLDFYFPGKRETVEVQPTAPQISAWIRESAYDASLKSSLYAFFYEPAVVTRLLSKELTVKAAMLSRMYEKSAALLNEREQRFDLRDLAKRLQKSEDSFAAFREVYVTFNLLLKNRLYFEFFKEQSVMFLGVDYADMADYLSSRRGLPELDVLFNALGEKNRLKILELLVRKGEVTVQDIDQELGFTGTHAYYHLAIMLKANIIRARSVDRTVLYSPNRGCLHAVGLLWTKYEGEDVNR